MEKTRMAVCKRIEDIRLEFNTRFPDVNDPPEDEHPMTAVGIVLISAIILGTTDIARLAKFTGYSENFISAIAFNMIQNKLWVQGMYDHSQCSRWYAPDGVISDESVFWEHIDMACGNLWMPGVETRSLDPCMIYWGERERPN